MINRIKQLILDGDYEIKFVKKFRGLDNNIPIKGFIMPDSDTILINKNLSRKEKTITIIHEFLHEIEPKWSESRVEVKSLNIYNKLKDNDKKFFKNIL